jgi:hypothetical protein
VKALFGLTFAALSLVACTHETQVRAPQIAFAAPIDPPSPCAAGEPRVIGRDPTIGPARTPERTLDRPGGSHLILWVEGSVESGYEIRAQLLSPRGTPIGAPFAVSQGKHAALPTLDAMFVGDERAEVTYYSSSERGFEVVTTAIVCGP